MKAYSLLTLLFAGMVAVSCKKDSTTSVTAQKLQGNYTGRVTATSDGKLTVINSAVSLKIADTKFDAETNNHTPLPSSGTYTINNSQVVFADSLVYPAIYSMSFILAGKFSAQIKGDSLILVKDDGSYSYRLKKQ